jgi:predicted methyltransferase
MLDRGDPRAALDGFNRYLSRGETALGEEALVGRALSSRKLGARENELAAWQEVLRRFPSSIHAELARSRLADLGER